VRETHRSLVWKSEKTGLLMCGAPVMIANPRVCSYFRESEKSSSACAHCIHIDVHSKATCRCVSREALLDVRIWEI